MTSTHNHSILGFVAVVAAIMATATAAYSEPATLSSALVIPGAYVSYNMREGYRKFEGVNEYQHVNKINPFAFGGYVGKRFPLRNPNLRAQVGAEAAWGTAKDDEYYVDLTSGDNILAGQHSYYLTGGVIAEAQFLLPYDENTAYLSLGPGVHAVRYSSALKTTSGQHIKSELDDKRRVKYTISANLGAGMEFRINDKRAVAVGYAFRFWQTARYTETDIFPMGADYREFFYSHALQVQFLVPGLDGKSRFARFGETD